jgi:hypothetical protein
VRSQIISMLLNAPTLPVAPALRGVDPALMEAPARQAGIPGATSALYEHGARQFPQTAIRRPDLDGVLRRDAGPRALRGGSSERRIYRGLGEFGVLPRAGPTDAVTVSDPVRVRNRIKSDFQC